jgi:hypothetical protein
LGKLYDYVSNLMGGPGRAFWPLCERTGDTPDHSVNAYLGVPYLCQLAAILGPDSSLPTLAVGTGPGSYIDAYSAPLSGSWNWQEGTIFLFCRAPYPSWWTDGLNHCLFLFQDSAYCKAQVIKSSAANSIYFYFRNAAAQIVQYTVPYSGADWFLVTVCYSRAGNFVRFYINSSKAYEAAYGTSSPVPALKSTGALWGAASSAQFSCGGFLAFGSKLDYPLSDGDVREIWEASQMTARLQLTYLDYDSEKSRVRFDGVTITAANLEAQFLLQDAIVDAIAGVSLCTHMTTERIASVGNIGATPPTDDAAQRENKWLIMMHDAVTLRKFRHEIPGADTSLLADGAPGSRKYMDPEGAEYLALKAAIEDYAKSPAGNAVVVDYAMYVGRSL